MATFGYSTNGGSASSIENVILGGKFTAPKTGTGQSISFIVAGTGSLQTVKCNVYNMDNTPVTGADTTGTVAATNVIVTQAFTGTPQFTIGTAYYLCIWSDVQVNSRTVKFTSVAAEEKRGIIQSLTFGAWPNPLVPVDNAQLKPSIYVNYTTNAVETVANNFQSISAPDGISVTEKAGFR